MPTLEFKVSGQHIERVDDVQPVAKSREYIDAHFEFLSPEWEGIKTAIFSSGGGAIRRPLDDNGNCVVPWEFWDTDDTTSGYVSVFCGDLVTADRAAVRMYRSGYVDADESREPTKDEYQQLVERVETATSEAKAAAKSTAEDRAAVESAKADIDKVAETFPQTVDKANKDITAEGSKQVKSVTTAGEEQIKAVTATGEEQIKAVAAEGSRQVETVTKAGQTQVQNVRDAVADLAITPTVTGSQIVARDTAEWPIQALTLYGRTEQATTSGAQLIDFTKCTYQNCTLVDAKTGTIKSNISNAYYCRLFANYLSEYLVANIGKTISFRADNNVNRISIVIYGYIPSNDAETSREANATGSKVSFAIPEEFTSITKVELRVNGKSSTFTDTSTLISGLMLYEGSEEKAYEPYTGGKPAPSPDYPQPIVNAGERLSTGKNLFNITGREVREPGGGGVNTELRNNLNGSGIYVGITTNNYYNPQYVVSNEISDNLVSLCLNDSASGYGIGFDYKVTPGQIYTISNNLSEQIGASFYTEQGEVVGTGACSIKSHTVTIPDNAYWMMIVFRPSTGATYTYTNIQMELSPTATAYEPYTGGVPAAYPVGIEAAVGGKNLLDPDTLSFSATYWTYSDGVWSTGNSKATYVYIDRYLKEGTYVFSVYCDSIQNGEGKLECRKDGTGIFVNYFTNTGRKEVKIDIDEDGEYRLLFGGTGYESLTFSKPQLELAPSATAYEPYRGHQTVTLASNGLPGIPVSSGGNYTDESGQQWVCDTIEYRGGQAVYVQRVWSKTFDGSADEGWAVYTNQGYEGFLINTLPEAMFCRAGICNLFLQDPKTNIGQGKSNSEGLWIGANGTTMYAHNSRFYDSTLTDKGLANWKAYLAAHPMTVMTYLTTPVETPLTESEAAQLAALHTYKPTTTITNDAGAEMEVEYVADTKAYIDNKFAELQSSIATTNAQLI